MNSKKNFHNAHHKPSCSDDVTKSSSTPDNSSLPNSNEKVPNQKPSVRKPKYTCQRKYYKPHIPPKKSAPVHVHISNPSAEIVLRERNVEIKDLESQVVFLKSQIREFQVENKTLLEVQARQEKELRRFKNGVADLPSVLKSHKDEIKAVESNAFSLRRELKECQKDIKAKNDSIFKKDQQIEKIHFILKRNEKQIQEATIENKELKFCNKKCEEECKKLSLFNEELKSKNDRLNKKIQQLNSTISEFEEKLGDEEHLKNQMKESLSKLQRKYDELLQSETALKKSIEVIKSDSSTQTISPETVSVSCMTITPLFQEETHFDKHRISIFEDSNNSGDMDQGSEIDFLWSDEEQKRMGKDFSFLFETKKTELDSRLHPKPSLKPLPMNFFKQNQDLSLGKVETKNKKHLSSKSLILPSNNFSSPDYFLNYPFSYESRGNQRRYDSEDSESMHYLSDHGKNIVSSSKIVKQRTKHLSNLTLK